MQDGTAGLSKWPIGGTTVPPRKLKVPFSRPSVTAHQKRDYELVVFVAYTLPYVNRES